VTVPAHVWSATLRLARRLAAEAAQPLRTLVVGDPASGARAALEGTLGPVTVMAPPAVPFLPGADGSVEVAVALDWLHRLEEPSAGLAQLRRLAPALLVAAPREPLAALGVRGTARLADRLTDRLADTGTAARLPARESWSGPGFLRFVSAAGAVRDVAHPLGWSLVWLRVD